MKKYISRFHYLTQDVPGFSHLELATAACEAGAKWIQYRSKNKTDKTAWLEEAAGLEAICDDWGTTLIICSSVEICLELAEAQGVHLERGDMPVKEARRLLGDDKTIGGSAHTLEDILAAHDAGADYVGLGPHKPTQTIRHSNDFLGAADYLRIAEELQKRNVDIPVIAAGGIKIGDVDGLMKTGIAGVAVSSAVNLSENPGAAYREFYKKLS
ncbi:thiamine-phosphate diphosphorylase [Anseongella ginsenosidimutans]|uniref:Thiamine-phosphate synthase n=1 Tax=Anseongella ginsenosidimutans TaxID=496056 RepID=A0A4R3KVZ1_9SPHI|nr:thiamine phosphate synthase [Anseongella ginsenosidimutans]QEC51757.1 thiamine phosphate synthase [Anseongella ginsenosidimutans]TCS89124.1 thiamine-phosphate diphosphorylase [Anseongella ginsenosidimutans]